MDTKELTVNTNRAERKEDPTITGFTFRVVDGVAFSVTEHWRGMDALYGGGLCIYVSARIWAIALPWIIKNSKQAA